jgi:type II secretory pathway component PulM
MMVTVQGEPDRREPLPSLLELPAFLLRKLSPSRRRRVLIGGSVLLVAVVAAAAVAVPQMRSEERDRAAQGDRQAAAARASLKARYAREARPIQGRGPAADGAGALGQRRQLVAGLQAAVLADARARARRGELHAHYTSTTCSAYPKQVHERPPAEDVEHATAVVECIAVASTVARDERTTSGSLIGQPYRARIDFAHGRYAFCKIVQMPGELSIQRDSILKVPTACGGRSS